MGLIIHPLWFGWDPRSFTAPVTFHCISSVFAREGGCGYKHIAEVIWILKKGSVYFSAAQELRMSRCVCLTRGVRVAAGQETGTWLAAGAQSAPGYFMTSLNSSSHSFVAVPDPWHLWRGRNNSSAGINNITIFMMLTTASVSLHSKFSGAFSVWY